MAGLRDRDHPCALAQLVRQASSRSRARPPHRRPAARPAPQPSPPSTSLRPGYRPRRRPAPPRWRGASHPPTATGRGRERRRRAPRRPVGRADRDWRRTPRPSPLSPPVREESSPPQASRTTLSTRSACVVATMRATRFPKAWPATVAGPSASALITAATSSARSAIVTSSSGLTLAPTRRLERQGAVSGRGQTDGQVGEVLRATPERGDQRDRRPGALDVHLERSRRSFYDVVLLHDLTYLPPKSSGSTVRRWV